MSKSPSEPPKDLFRCVPPKIHELQVTKEELRNIAINFYKYYFEEEFEWKGILPDKEDIILSIIPMKIDSLILAYEILYNPVGTVTISAWKNRTIFYSHGNGDNNFDIFDKVKEIQVKDLPSIIPFPYFKQKQIIDSGIFQIDEKDQEVWNKFSVSPDQFKDRHDYKDRIVKPEWVNEKYRYEQVKKKVMKNTLVVLSIVLLGGFLYVVQD
jgi:hypothetical protein